MLARSRALAFALPKVRASLLGDSVIRPPCPHALNETVLLKRFDSPSNSRFSNFVNIPAFGQFRTKVKRSLHANHVNYHIFVKKFKDRVGGRVHPFPALSHWIWSVSEPTYNHRYLPNLTYDTPEWCKIPQRLIQAGCMLITNDRQPRKVHITTSMSGPEGPAVVERIMEDQPHDRTRTFGRAAQSSAGISYDGLPGEDAHKDQLQGVVARHPIAPDVREANE